jgi:hypothetical protein
MFARGSWIGILLVALVGCGMQYVDGGYTCANPEKGHIGSDGLPDPCHYLDAPDAGLGSGCGSSEAVHVSLGWDGPTRLWFGDEEQAPECPYGSASTSYEGHADLVAPLACEACACEPPIGSCALPSTLTVSTSSCGVAGGVSTSFNAPDPWDGHCDSSTQSPAGVANSLTIGALTMMENGCAPALSAPAKVVSSYWKTFARACDGKGWTLGALSKTICIPPEDPTPPDFRLCIFQKGDNDCPIEPGNVFTERHLFYSGAQDDRQCSTCTCGAPTGSVCTATVSIYKGNDVTCNVPTVMLPISSMKTTCVDIQLPGQPLGSKSAGPTTYIPGICPSGGGDASGSASQTGPATLCCRP